MIRIIFAVLASGLMVAPATAQWASDYNMGTLGVMGGNSASGTISVQCADAGNGTVKQGDLSIFIKPGAASMVGTASPGKLKFEFGDSNVSLPVADDAGDGFVYDKTPTTLGDARALIGLLKSSSTVAVLAGSEQIANVRLDGAVAALAGVEACLVP